MAFGRQAAGVARPHTAAAATVHTAAGPPLGSKDGSQGQAQGRRQEGGRGEQNASQKGQQREDAVQTGGAGDCGGAGTGCDHDSSPRPAAADRGAAATDARGRGAKIVHGKAIAFSLLARQQKFHENLVWLPAVKKTKNIQDKAMEAEPKAKKQKA